MSTYRLAAVALLAAALAACNEPSPSVPATWSFRRIVDAQGAAHFRATLHTGSESELSFVREASQSDMAALSEAAEQDRLTSSPP